MRRADCRGSALQTLLVGRGSRSHCWLPRNATRSDLGLPSDALASWSATCRIGVIAWLAAVAPVFVTQFTFILLWGPGEGHPADRTLLVSGPSIPARTLLVAFDRAVVVAPLCEEIVFAFAAGLAREMGRWRLGWRTANPAEVRMADDSRRTPDGSVARRSTIVIPSIRLILREPPQHGLGRPALRVAADHCISSLLFALAHLAMVPTRPAVRAGPDSRLRLPADASHRAVDRDARPFNGMSLFALWRMIRPVGSNSKT